ncbi:synaptic vesicle glycoprotein 2C-like isoform X2 [Condylostylus longicornis]|nr:synaptic vesicle glycoprotein 2C-like isoform X2 [Condylostylus longicornis]
MTETMGVSIILVSVKCDLNLTLQEQGYLASAGFLGVVFSAHTMGLLSDTCGRNKTLKYSVFLASICSFLSVFANTIWTLIIIRFLVGFFMNACQSCSFSYLGEFHSSKTKTKFVTFLIIFFAIGATYFPATGIGILPQEYNIYLGSIKFSSWRVLLLINSIPTLVACITLPFFPESPKFLLVQGKQDEAIDVLRKVYKFNTGKNPNTFPVSYVICNEDLASDLSKVKNVHEALKIMWAQTKPLFDKQRRWTTINLSICQFVIFFVCHGSFMWIPGMIKPLVEYSDTNLTLCESFRLYTEELRQISGNLSIYDDYNSECSPSRRVDVLVLEILIIAGIGFGFVYFVFAFIIDFVGKRRLLLIWMTLCGPPILGLIWARGFAFNIILLFFYMLYADNAGLITSITVAYYPTNISGMALCLITMMARLGSFVGSNVTGIILNYQCEFLFILLGSMVCLLFVLWNFLPNDKKQKENVIK